MTEPILIFMPYLDNNARGVIESQKKGLECFHALQKAHPEYEALKNEMDITDAEAEEPLKSFLSLIIIIIQTLEKKPPYKS